MLSDSSRGHVGAVWVALFVTILWSSSWVLIRWGLDEEALTPLTFAALRYGLAAANLVGWVLRDGSSRGALARLDAGLFARLLALGIVAVSVGVLLTQLPRRT